MLLKQATYCGYSLWHPDDEKAKCSSSHMSHLGPSIPGWHSQFPVMGSHSSDKDPTASQEHATQPAVKLPNPGCKIPSVYADYFNNIILQDPVALSILN
jgi:hypothetical protein